MKGYPLVTFGILNRPACRQGAVHLAPLQACCTAVAFADMRINAAWCVAEGTGCPANCCKSTACENHDYASPAASSFMISAVLDVGLHPEVLIIPGQKLERVPVHACGKCMVAVHGCIAAAGTHIETPICAGAGAATHHSPMAPAEAKACQSIIEAKQGRVIRRGMIRQHIAIPLQLASLCPPTAGTCL